jgi:hypothetical protein
MNGDSTISQSKQAHLRVRAMPIVSVAVHLKITTSQIPPATID